MKYEIGQKVLLNGTPDDGIYPSFTIIEIFDEKSYKCALVSKEGEYIEMIIPEKALTFVS